MVFLWIYFLIKYLNVIVRQITDLAKFVIHTKSKYLFGKCFNLILAFCCTHFFLNLNWQSGKDAVGMILLAITGTCPVLQI